MTTCKAIKKYRKKYFVMLITAFVYFTGNKNKGHFLYDRVHFLMGEAASKLKVSGDVIYHE